MNQNEHWKKIVLAHDEKAIIPFLQQLDEAAKKALLPLLSKTTKEYLEIKDRLINHKHFYAKKASLKQERILNYSIFVCVTDSSHPLHDWLTANIIITPFTVECILHWYCPTWFNTYLNSFADQKIIPTSISYELVIQMLKKGYFKPSELLIARLFPLIIFPKTIDQRLVHEFSPEKLGIFPITLAQHLWYLFEFPTNIYGLEKQLNLKNKADLPKNCWYTTIKISVDSGDIDRVRLFTACLQATSKPVFNKRAISWFIGLFDFLVPTIKEIIDLQTALFATYRNSQAKVLNSTLKNLQKIISSPAFQVKNSLKNFEQILSNPNKSVLKNALIFLEKTGEFHPNYQAKIPSLAIRFFEHREENIQYRAAKLIQLYSSNHSDLMANLIAPYQKYLFQKPLQVLKNINPSIGHSTLENQYVKPKKIKVLSQQNKIPPISSFSKFEALAAIIFDNQQPYHFDQFLVGLVQFQSEIKGKKIEQLTPLFKRAYQLVFNELPSHQGMLDNLLAVFLLDWSDLLISRHPTESQSLQKLANDYLAQGFYLKEPNIAFDLQETHLKRWYNPYDPSQVYTPFKRLLSTVLAYLNQEQSLPLLSTPTHAPTWIDPKILVERLLIYQEENQFPATIDLQLAISRTCFENKGTALEQANTSLTGKYLTLIQFLLNTSTTLPNNFKEINYEKELEISPFYFPFITAAITKNSSHLFKQKINIPNLKIAPSYFTGQHDWMIFWEEQHQEEWNYKTQRLELTAETFIHREIQIKFPRGLNKNHYPDFLYQYIPGTNEGFRPNVNDIQRLLGMLPNNPAPLIALLIGENLKYPAFWERTAKKRVEEILLWLAPTNPKKHSYASHFFIALCLINIDRKIRLSAAKIWINAVAHQQFDPILMGQILGKVTSKEFAPIKRFTDLAYTRFFNISDTYNQALEKLIGHLLAKLPALPVKNTKQLLVLYRELLTINKSKITHQRLLILLELWTKSTSLKKVIRELEAFC
ncbi:MAG: DUF6493 family protein [Saprospiraceae bacterium]